MWTICEDGRAARAESKEIFHTDRVGRIFSPLSIFTSLGSDANHWQSSLCFRQEKAFV